MSVFLLPKFFQPRNPYSSNQSPSPYLSYCPPVEEAPSPQPAKKPPTVLLRLEDFYYSGTWNQFALIGPPHFPYEYSSILDIQLHQKQVGIRAETKRGIVEDLWEVVWKNDRPSLEFKARLSFDVKEIRIPQNLDACCGEDKLKIGPSGHATKVTITRLGEQPWVNEFAYKKPIAAIMNAKWTAIAWEGGEVTVVGKDEYNFYERTYKSERTIRFMLLDENDGLMTLSDKGVCELWNLPTIMNKTGGRFNQATFFKDPHQKNPMHDGDFEQLQGSLTDVGQLCFIGRKRHGNWICLQASRPLTAALVEERKHYLQSEGVSAIPPMSLNVANSLYPDAGEYIRSLEKEASTLRTQAANAQSEKNKAVDALKMLRQQVADMQPLVKQKQQLQEQLAELTTAQLKQTQALNQALQELMKQKEIIQKSELTAKALEEHKQQLAQASKDNQIQKQTLDASLLELDRQKQLGKHSEKQLQELDLQKQRLQTQLAEKATAYTQRCEELDKVIIELSQTREHYTGVEKQSQILNEAFMAARMQEESSRGALAQLQKDFDAAKNQLAEAKASLESAAAKNSCDPVTYEPLTNPIALVCGHVFNLSTMEGHRKQDGKNCPCCQVLAPPANDRRLFIEPEA